MTTFDISPELRKALEVLSDGMKPIPCNRIRFKEGSRLRASYGDGEFVMIGGAIATQDDYESFRESLCHCSKDGIVRRYGNRIGTREDIEIVGPYGESAPAPLAGDWKGESGMYGNQMNGSVQGYASKTASQVVGTVPQIASEPEVLRLLNDLDQAVSAAHSWMDTLQGRLAKVTGPDTEKAPDAPSQTRNTEVGHILASQCERIQGLCVRLSNQITRLEI